MEICLDPNNSVIKRLWCIDYLYMTGALDNASIVNTIVRFEEYPRKMVVIF